MKKNSYLTLAIGLIISIAIIKISSIFTTLAFFSMISVKIITSSTMAYLLESLVKMVIFFIVIYFTLKVIRQKDNKLLYPYLIFYLILTILVQGILHVISMNLNNSPFELGRIFPELELIVGGVFYIYYYFIKKIR